MPSDLSTWFIAVPNDSDAEGLPHQLRQKLEYARALPRSNISDLAIPQLKVRYLGGDTQYLV
jgi:V-type H+-transporting ATPase subunit C